MMDYLQDTRKWEIISKNLQKWCKDGRNIPKIFRQDKVAITTKNVFKFGIVVLGENLLEL